MTREEARDGIEKIKNYLCAGNPMWDTSTISSVLDVAIKALEQPERNGEWIGTEFDGYADGNPVYYEWKCSACGCIVEDEEPTWNYCPNCGADMREGGER